MALSDLLLADTKLSPSQQAAFRSGYTAFQEQFTKQVNIVQLMQVFTRAFEEMEAKNKMDLKRLHAEIADLKRESHVNLLQEKIEQIRAERKVLNREQIMREEAEIKVEELLARNAKLQQKMQSRSQRHAANHD